MENAYTYAKNANDALNLAGLTGVADPARIWGNQRQQTKRWHCEKSVKFLCVFNYFGFFEGIYEDYNNAATASHC